MADHRVETASGAKQIPPGAGLLDIVLGTLKRPRTRPNGRSGDFIAPSLSNGCAMACAYCYVPRRKGFANPITVFCNSDKILAHVERHKHHAGHQRASPRLGPDTLRSGAAGSG